MDNFVVLYTPTFDCVLCGTCLDGGVEVMNKPVNAVGCYHRGGKIVGTVADKWAAKIAHALASVHDRAGTS